jgi:SAM-dependent methyltransferase
VAGGDDTGTWHFGLVARWWAEFNTPQPEEVEYLRRAIEHHGQPALDLGCGNGRILLPLLQAGLDVDGADISPDMIDYARRAAERAGFSPTLTAQPMHELDLPRRYRTIFMVGAFGIGGDREHEREALVRVYAHLEPGGTLLINHQLPYADLNEEQWARWLPGHRTGVPRDWPESGDRRRAADGDEIELMTRLAELNPITQRLTYEMRARLWHDGAVVQEETSRLHESLYFAQEIRELLREVGFEDVEIESGYTGQPATAEDGVVMFVVRRPAVTASDGSSRTSS